MPLTTPASPGDRLLAHGIGGAKDLPIPLDLAIAGAAAALAVSFIVLALAWRTPRYATEVPGGEDLPGTARERPLPRLGRLVDSTALTLLARGFGLVVLGWALWAAVAGQDLLTNPFLGMFYIYLWVGIVPLSLLLGPFYRAVSPMRTITALLARASGTDPDEGLFRWPERLGYWPAALGLFAFVWFELVFHSSTELGPVRLWFTLYVAAMLLGGALFGNRFLARCDPFEVYSTLVGHLSVWGRRDGELVLRSPLANLAAVPAAPGLVAVVGMLFGSTAFDSFKESSAWLQLTQARLEQAYLLDNLALLAFCAAATGLFAAACTATSVREGIPHRRLPDAFAHSVVPIVVGYVAAHYLTLLLEQGQMTLAQLSDPLSRGDDLLGTADWQVRFFLSERPRLLATTKVAGVVLGHVLGVVAAHDRAIALLPRRSQLTGQLPLLAVMVAFTVGGLYLLFSA